MSALLGGFSAAMDAHEETQSFCDQVKSKVEEKTKKKYDEFRAVKYREQTVAGKNFFIKVHVGGDSYLHVKVFQGLSCSDRQVTLHEVQTDVGRDDPIAYF